MYARWRSQNSNVPTSDSPAIETLLHEHLLIRFEMHMGALQYTQTMSNVKKGARIRPMQPYLCNDGTRECKLSVITAL